MLGGLLQGFKSLPTGWKVAAVLGTGTAAAITGGPAVVTAMAALSQISPAVLIGAGTAIGLPTATLVARLGWKKHPKADDDTEADRNGDESGGDGEQSAIACFSLDDLVRSSIVRAVVLELQGLPEAEICGKIEKIFAGIGDTPVRTADDAKRLIETIALRISATNN